MRIRTIGTVLAIVALFSVASQAQSPAQTPPIIPPQRPDRTDHDVTYGRVKEFTAGQKIVIDVDNAPDKNYDLSDKNTAFKLEKGLNVGDPVKITEHDGAGKKKTIEIAKHSGGGVKHGDSDRKQQ
jgi:hypothetical protein